MINSLRKATVSFILLLSLFNSSVWASPSWLEDDYEFRPERRINAHGDEFMAIALTNDGQRLIVGTESGTLLVWGIRERRILKQLNQGSPVHCVVTLENSDTFVAAGGPHTGGTHSGVIRKWHISSGKYEDWQTPAKSSFLTLVPDSENGLLAGACANGELGLWNSRTGELLSKTKVDGIIVGLAITGREIYLTSLTRDDIEGDEPSPNSVLRYSVDKLNQEPSDFTKNDGTTIWSNLELSDSGQFLAARASGANRRIVLFDVAGGKELASFDAQFAAWTRNGDLILFDREVAIARITFDSSGRVSRSDLLKTATWHASGTPTNMTGQVISPDGAKTWQIFQVGAALVESDLITKKFDLLHDLRGYIYAVDVRERLGFIATGGDDEFVRVRKLSDLSLVSEFHVKPGVPQGVALLDDGRHIVFSASTRDTPTSVSIGDLVSGNVRTLFEVHEPFVRVVGAAGGFIYNKSNKLVLASGTTGATVREFRVEPALEQYEVSENGEWLVAANEDGQLYCFAVKTGRRFYVSREKVESLTRLAITDDGRYVYTTDFQASLRRWDTTHKTMKEISSIRGQARSLRLSTDEKRILVGGNHRDVSVYDVATGERISYLQVTSADFYVTNVWLGGDRLVFTTDAGVLLDGRLQR